MLYYMQGRTAYATNNEKYRGITRIEQPEDRGLCISYVYIMYKRIDSISCQPAFIHTGMPGHICHSGAVLTDQNIYTRLTVGDVAWIQVMTDLIIKEASCLFI